MTDPKNPRNVAITGAGSGIGRATAERLAGRGDSVVGTVRDPARAAALTDRAREGGLDLRYVPLELESLEQVATLAADLDAWGVDVLVHNAGFGVFGPVEEVDLATAQRQFAVNFFGPLELTRLLLPGLRARRGRIVWIGSLAGRMALPFQAHYSATKAAIASLSDALRMELAPHGVQVTCIEPGDFATGFTDARAVARADASVYRAAVDRCLAAVDGQERGGPSPDWVGRVVDVVTRRNRPPARRPVGRLARTMCALLRVLPDRVRERVVKAHYGQ